MLGIYQRFPGLVVAVVLPSSCREPARGRLHHGISGLGIRTFSVVTKLTVRASSSGRNPIRSFPASNIRPDLIFPNPAVARSKVLFPLPLRPSRAISPPPSKLADTWSSRTSCRILVLKIPMLYHAGRRFLYTHPNNYRNSQQGGNTIYG